MKIMNFKNFSNFNFGFAALFKKTAMEFRKSIINYNELTRGYVHLEYSVKKIKILIVKSKMATVLKLSNSIFALIFVIFRLPHLIQRHACTAPIFFTLPGPAKTHELKIETRSEFQARFSYLARFQSININNQTNPTPKGNRCLHVDI